MLAFIDKILDKTFTPPCGVTGGKRFRLGYGSKRTRRASWVSFLMTGCGKGWLIRRRRKPEIAGSNPAIQTCRRQASMVKRQSCRASNSVFQVQILVGVFHDGGRSVAAGTRLCES